LETRKQVVLAEIGKEGEMSEKRVENVEREIKLSDAYSVGMK